MSKGDHLYIKRMGGTYTHHGIDCGDGTVIQYSGFADGISSGPVNRVAYDEFADGETVKTFRYPALYRKNIETSPLFLPPEYRVFFSNAQDEVCLEIKYTPDEIIQRAMDRLGEENYSLFLNNCEHFAHWCITGMELCTQLKKMVELYREIPFPGQRKTVGEYFGNRIFSGTGACDSIIAEISTGFIDREVKKSAVMPPILSQSMKKPSAIPDSRWGGGLTQMLREFEIINLRHGEQLADPLDIANLAEEMAGFRLTVPLIGRVSSGKSSLLNAWLGRHDLLEKGLDATTALPYEIFYSSQEYTALGIPNFPTVKRNISELHQIQNEECLENAETVRIGIDSEELGKRDCITIVDMPGSDSGIRSHDEALLRYAPTSPAFILVIDAEMQLTDSVLRIIDTLGLLKAKVHAVITKCDLLTERHLDEIESSVRSVLEHKTGKNISVIRTSARLGDTSALGGLADSIIAEAPGLFYDTFAPKFAFLLEKAILKAERFLIFDSFDETRLREEEVRLHTEKIRMEGVLAGRMNDMHSRLERASEKILAEIHAGLTGNLDFLKTIVTQESLEHAVSGVLREQMINSIETHLAPVLNEFTPSMAEIHRGTEGYASRRGQGNEQGASGSVFSVLFSGVMGGSFVSAAAKRIVQGFFEKKAEKQREELLRTEFIPSVVNRCRELLDRLGRQKINILYRSIQDDMALKTGLPCQILKSVQEARKSESAEWEEAAAALRNDITLMQRMKTQFQ